MAVKENNGTFHDIEYKFKGVEFRVQFYIVNPPQEYKYNIPPSLENVKIFHKGDDMSNLLNRELTMDLINKLHKEYCKLPNK